MFDISAGTYASSYELDGGQILDTITFYPSPGGGYVGVGDVDSENWRLVLELDACGRGKYVELNVADKYSKVGEGVVFFYEIYEGVFGGEWRTVDDTNNATAYGSWLLIHETLRDESSTRK